MASSTGSGRGERLSGFPAKERAHGMAGFLLAGATTR
jgi:hypothetical protein